MGNRHGNFQLHRFTTSENIAKSFRGATFLTHTALSTPVFEQVDKFRVGQIAYMGGPHGQKSVWATAHTAHTVPAPMAITRKSIVGFS